MVMLLVYSNMLHRVDSKDDKLLNDISAINPIQRQSDETGGQTSPKIKEQIDEGDSLSQVDANKNNILSNNKENLQESIISKWKRSNPIRVKPLKGEAVSLYYQLNGQLSDSRRSAIIMPEINIGPRSSFTSANDEMTKKYPKAKYLYPRYSDICVELVNNSDIALLNPEIWFYVGDGGFFEIQNSVAMWGIYYEEKVDGVSLYHKVVWKMKGNIKPQGHISYSIPLNGAVVFNEYIRVNIVVIADNYEPKTSMINLYFND